jgi:hypothetical protein
MGWGAVDASALERERWSAARFVPGDPGGHYESWFQRANHPTRPLAFWIRYTIFAPRGRPEAAVGELWAIAFDGESGRITAAKQEHPISACAFSDAGLGVRIGAATLSARALTGSAESRGHRLAWQLAVSGGGPPLLLLPARLYAGGFPKAKSLVTAPGAIYQGWLEVDGARLPIEGWRGSLNHNWGSRHTDRYAWGQVAGFDEAPDAFLECSTARVRLGPLWSPWLTLVVLRVGDRELAINGLLRSALTRARLEGTVWRFESRGRGVRVRGHIEAPAASFVGLRYANPPGGEKICLNTKLARCELVLEEPGRPPRRLFTQSRAAFELLRDEPDPRIPLVA